jgi:hypothetical protein
MYAQKDRDSISVLKLRVLSEHPDREDQLANDVPIDEKDRHLRPRGDCGRLSVLLG